MFFTSTFVDYSAGNASYEKIKTLDPRDPARAIASHVAIQEPADDSNYDYMDGDHWIFMDRVDFDEFYFSSRTNKTGNHRGPFPTYTDPYLGRKRAFVRIPADLRDGNPIPGFSIHPTVWNDPNPPDFEVGTLQVLKRDDGVETNSDLFLTYPFERTLSARTITQTRVDGSTYERIIGGENRMFMSTTVVPKGGYSDEDDTHEKFTGIALASEFLFVSELQPWDMWLFKRTPQTQYRWQTRRYNDQRITLRLEVL